MSPAVVEPPPELEESIEEETGEEADEQTSPPWRVIGHDDPVTTMQFVVEVLRSVFGLPGPRAAKVMLEIHHTGSALVGTWPEDEARTKVARATARARANGFPLTFTVEKD